MPRDMAYGLHSDCTNFVLAWLSLTQRLPTLCGGSPRVLRVVNDARQVVGEMVQDGASRAGNENVPTEAVCINFCLFSMLWVWILKRPEKTRGMIRPTVTKADSFDSRDIL